MRHLSAVPDLVASVDPIAAGDELPGVRHDPPAHVLEMYRRTELLMEGLVGDDRLAVARTFYIDANGNPQARSLLIRPA